MPDPEQQPEPTPDAVERTALDELAEPTDNGPEPGQPDPPQDPAVVVESEVPDDVDAPPADTTAVYDEELEADEVKVGAGPETDTDTPEQAS